jgi:LysM repeat protein
LATRFHTTQAAIREANKLKSAQIRVGQRLAIPDLAEQSASKPAAAAVQPSEPAAATKVEAAPAKTAVTAPPKGEAKAEPKAAAAKTPATPPGKSASAAAASAPTTPQTASSVAGKGIRIHVVDPDEDLYSVAMMWGVSVAELKELNGLTNTTLKPGDRLKIPMTEQ